MNLSQEGLMRVLRYMIGIMFYCIQYGDQNREFVSIEDIPEHTKWAVLAAEDIEFYQHKGLIMRV